MVWLVIFRKAGWVEVNDFCNGVLPVLDQVDKLLTRNRIFMDRTEGIGVISKEMALAYGLTGPNLRATGVGFGST